jgi:steroid delta-isomerase-like uncharacterized protein
MSRAPSTEVTPMRAFPRIVLACVLSLGLVACGADEAPKAAARAPVATRPVPPPKAAGVAIVEQHLAAYNAHDIDGAGALLHDQVLYFDSTYADSFRGRAAAIDNLISPYVRAIPDLEWTLRSEPIAAGDGIAYEWTLTGTNTGTFMGIPARNQKINLKGVSFVRIKDGKIIYKADYYDAATLNKQLGWQ